MFQLSLQYVVYVFKGLILFISEDDPKLPLAEAAFQKCGKKKWYMGIYRKEKPGQHYLRTGVLGDYETAGITSRKLDSKPVSLFEDTDLKECEDGSCLERRMLVGGKLFVVRSVFPESAALTPTDKMLELIDTQIKKESHSPLIQ